MSASLGPIRGKAEPIFCCRRITQGEVPKDGFVYHSRTYNVFLFWRSFFKDPNDLSERR